MAPNKNLIIGVVVVLVIILLILGVYLVGGLSSVAVPTTFVGKHMEIGTTGQYIGYNIATDGNIAIVPYADSDDQLWDYDGSAGPAQLSLRSNHMSTVYETALIKYLRWGSNTVGGDYSTFWTLLWGGGRDDDFWSTDGTYMYNVDYSNKAGIPYYLAWTTDGKLKCVSAADTTAIPIRFT